MPTKTEGTQNVVEMMNMGVMTDFEKDFKLLSKL
jgi:hypothetical protein